MYLPVIVGVWNQDDLWNGKYTFDDWADMIEIIRVKNENEYRALNAKEVN